mgnify:CR=1 FL=1
MDQQNQPIPFLVPGPAADCSVGIAIAHFKHPLQDVIQEARAAQKRAKNQLGRSAVAVTLLKRSGETIEWGCQWGSGGLEAYTKMMEAVQNHVVSAKFPYRIVELVDGYQTGQAEALGSMSPADGFDQVVLQIVDMEIATAADRQRGPAYDPEAAQELRSVVLAYLKHPRLRTTQDKVQALIGLCQTVAFIARSLPESSSAISDQKSETQQPAERQLV